MEMASMHLADGEEDPKQRAPWVSLALAYAAMLPVVAGGGACWLAPAQAGLILRLTLAWSGAVLCFLAGVRRGLSFRQPGGPTVGQLAATMWLFTLGAGSLLAPWALASAVLQLLGFAGMAVLDPIAARRGEAPRYFGRLRPLQMAVPVLGLLLVLGRLLA
jgi:hypothetical protein